MDDMRAGPRFCCYGRPGVARSVNPFLSNSRISLGEAIARELEMEITGGVLHPGERLGTKEELRARFGVALATVNEALRLLEMRGMLTARPGPGGGIFVAKASARVRLNQFVLGYRWSEAAVADHHTVRNALEPLVCREAARYRRDADIRVLRNMLDAMEGRLDDPMTYIRRTLDLHRRIAKIIRNVPLRSIYVTMLDFLENSAEQAEYEEFDGLDHLARHRELVDAIAEGPSERLEAAIEAHELRISFDT
jgi:DNA-binding FadR family transcriptional regulator